MNIILLRIIEHDTSKPLGIYDKPFANNVHDYKYHKQSSVLVMEPILA